MWYVVNSVNVLLCEEYSRRETGRATSYLRQQLAGFLPAGEALAAVAAWRRRTLAR